MAIWRQYQKELQRALKREDELIAKNKVLRVKVKRLNKEIIQLKTQMLGGSENDRCAIEGMNEGQAPNSK